MPIVARLTSAINLSRDITDVGYGDGHQGVPRKPPASFDMRSINCAVSVPTHLGEGIIFPSRRTSRSASSHGDICCCRLSYWVGSATKLLTSAIAHILGV